MSHSKLLSQHSEGRISSHMHSRAIVGPEETGFARQLLGKHVTAATNTHI
jgi:hypothetical protein